MPSYTVHTVIAASLYGNEVGRHLARASDGRLWCFFADKPAGYSNYQLFCAYSDNKGETWTEEQITTVDIYQYTVTVAIDSQDNLHIVYAGRGRQPYTSRTGIFYRKRTATGWGTEETVALKDVSGGQQSPSIAIDSGDNVHVVWYGKGWGTYPARNQIIYCKRTAIWGSPEEITSTNVSAYGEQYPAIAIDRQDNIHLTWQSTQALLNYTMVRYRKGIAGGWHTQEDVNTHDDGYAVSPRIALDSSDNIHIVWRDMLASESWVAYNPKYRKRTIAGWGVTEDIATIAFSQKDYLTIAIDSLDNAHVVWTGQGWGTNLNKYNIQYRKRTASGWQTQEAITDEAVDHFGGSALWANFPVISGARTNIIHRDDFYIVYEKLGEAVMFYSKPTGILGNPNVDQRIYQHVERIEK